MREFSGKSVNKKIAVGPIAVLKKKELSVQEVKIEDAEQEIYRLNHAIEVSRKQLQELFDEALKEAGESAAAIFKVHEMLLGDGGFLKAIHHMICEEEASAEYAAAIIGERYAARFQKMDNEYMKARAADMRNLSSRLVRNLSGGEEEEVCLTEPSIVYSEDFTPGEIIRMDRTKILALVSKEGSVNSHTVILANMMNIPALVGVSVEFSDIQNGMMAIVDGLEGKMILEPSENLLNDARKRIQQEKEHAALLAQLKGKESKTSDGRKINIYANIGDLSALSEVQENDAEGIGLFRSECLYMGRADFPAEEEQFQVYKQILKTMKEKKVVVRTLDLGADKQVEYFPMEKEENPALGYRGIRICLKEPDIFKTQLCALLRAAVYGNLSVMYPMITSAEEVKRVLEILEEVKKELDEEHISFKVPEQGIMIETPAAAMISDELAELVDFCSIGTNDLTQYMLAADRQNKYVEEFYNPRHKAVLKMVKMVVENVHKAGKWVGICGELAGDETLTEEFVRMGVDELSVSPAQVLSVRKKIRDI